MSGKIYFATLKTNRGESRMLLERNRELFVKTLKVMQASGKLRIEAFNVLPGYVRLLFRSKRPGIVVVGELAGMSERIMQLACRTRSGRFWDCRYTCRQVESTTEIEGLRDFIHSESRKVAADLHEYCSQGDRWHRLNQPEIERVRRWML